MKKTLIIAFDGFEETELVATADIIRRGGISCEIYSMTGREVLKGNNGMRLVSDCIMEKDPDVAGYVQKYDGIVLPGGGPNAMSLRDDERCIELLKAFYNAGKMTAAICAAPIALEKAGLLKGKKATSYTDMLDKKNCEYIPGSKAQVTDNIITSCGPGGAYEFGYAIVEKLAGKAMSVKIKKDMLY